MSASMAVLNPIDHIDFNATACTFYTTYLPMFHSAASSDEPLEDHPENLPILDTGATHCLMPLSWLGEEECELAQRIHLKVATRTTVRALLYNNVIYAKAVNRPLVSVGQLKGMLDLRFVWDDASPLLLACHAGKKYVVTHANIVHHLPLISRSELYVLLNAIRDFTTKGEMWTLQRWSSELKRDLDEFHWNCPPSTPIVNHVNAAQGPQAMYSAIDFSQDAILNSVDSIDETFSTHYPEPTAEVAEKDSSTSKNNFWSSNPREKWPSEDRTLTTTAKTIRELNPQPSTLEIHDLEENDAPTEDEILAGDISAMSLKEAVEVLQRHSLLKARSRTNVSTEKYTPQGRLFGAFTTRGEGITQATYRYPKVVNAIHRVALERGKEAETEGYLSAQLNRASALPVHKDKTNHGMSWLIALGDFDGGRLWLDDRLGSQPPPKCTHAWEKKLRGSYYDVKDIWFQFQPYQVPCGGRSDAWSPNLHCIVFTQVLDEDSAKLFE